MNQDTKNINKMEKPNNPFTDAMKLKYPNLDIERILEIYEGYSSAAPHIEAGTDLAKNFVIKTIDEYLKKPKEEESLASKSQDELMVAAHNKKKELAEFSKKLVLDIFDVFLTNGEKYRYKEIEKNITISKRPKVVKKVLRGYVCWDEKFKCEDTGEVFFVERKKHVTTNGFFIMEKLDIGSGIVINTKELFDNPISVNKKS